IFTAEIAREINNETSNRRCNICERTGHHPEAEYCYHCGVTLPESRI
ncbi:MAG: ion transporter, partial [Porticoccaceae bacterium]|nr:ion transporter [Porticoccaceae bacterium]